MNRTARSHSPYTQATCHHQHAHGQRQHNISSEGAVNPAAVDRAVSGVSVGAIHATQPGVSVDHPDRLLGEPLLTLEHGLHGVVHLTGAWPLVGILHHAPRYQVGNRSRALLGHLCTALKNQHESWYASVVCFVSVETCKHNLY